MLRIYAGIREEVSVYDLNFQWNYDVNDNSTVTNITVYPWSMLLQVTRC